MKVKIFFLSFILGARLLLADNSNSLEVKTEEESLFLRRVVEFYEEKETPIVKREIHKYLAFHPQSSFTDHLLIILGDIYMDDKDYQRAVASYSNIKSEELKTQTVINLIQCLYELDRYKDVISQTLIYLKKNTAINHSLYNRLIFLLGDSFYQEANLLEKENDQKTKYLNRAKSCFKNLLTTNYKNESLYYLAQIYQLLDERLLAGEIFMSLAEKHEDKKEQYLYQAAVLISSDKPKKAIDILEEITQMKKEKASDAALLQMKLLFTSEDYLDLIASRRHFLRVIDENQKHLVFLYVGKSHFLLEEHEKGIFNT